MDKQEAFGILKENIQKDLKHPDYDHVVALATKYEQLITGKNIASLYKRFNPRESEEMFNQRLALSIAITPALAHSVMSPYFKVPRTTPLSATFQLKKDVVNKDKAIEDIQKAFDEYYGSDTDQGGVDFFMQNRYMELTFLDPNAWIVTEFDDFDANTEKPKPRPFEVEASQAVNFEVINNVTQWLRVDIDIMMENSEGKFEEGKKHTLYADDWAVVFEQTLQKETDLQLDDDETYLEINEKFYIVRYFEIKIGKVPAFRIGYKRDLETKGRTFVNPFHPAMCYFDKCIKAVSEYDLTQCLHVFPQKTIRIGKGCPGVPGDVNNGICKGGKLVTGETCPTCKGTGKPIHTSSQDVIEVELPENIKEDGFLPLSEFIYYVQLPVELLNFQKATVKEFTQDIHQATFGTTVLVQKYIAPGTTNQTTGEVTATQNDNDMESVYDTLSPFSDKYSAVWRTVVGFIAILLDYEDDIIIQHRFPTNVKLKTRQYLFVEYKYASEGDMPPFVIDAIMDELAENIFMDDIDNLVKYRIKKKYAPFRGKSKEEVMMLLTDTNVLKETKVLYNYFEDIFAKLEMTYTKAGKDLYLQKADVIQADIDKQITDIIKKLDLQQPKTMALPGIDPANPEA